MELACLLPSRLRRVGSDLDATAYAVAAANNLGRLRLARGIGGVTDTVDLVDALKSVGCRVDVRELYAAEGGVRATMSPHGDRYWFVVDPVPAPLDASRPGEVDRAGASLVQWRLAHELGHVLFRDFAGRRMSPVTDAEESFCDRFADALLFELSDAVAVA